MGDISNKDTSIRDKAKQEFTRLIQKGINTGRINKIPADDIATLSTNLEIGIFNYAIRRCKDCNKNRNWEEPAFKQYYKEQFSFLREALDIDKNEYLLIKLVKKDIDCDTLCAKKNINDLVDHWISYGMSKEEILGIDKTAHEEITEEEPDGLFRCRHCKSWKTTVTELQTRSADEAMTSFILCKKCGKQSKK